MKILSVYQAHSFGPDGKLPKCDYVSEGCDPSDIKLFEAAQELLDALQLAVKWHTLGAMPPKHIDDAWMNQAKAAIAKATGVAPDDRAKA